MLYFFAIILFLLGLIFKKSRSLSYLIFIYLWILFAFSFENADYYIHLRRFNYYDVLTSQTEILYNFLMSFFNTIGLSYRAYLIIISFFILLVFLKFISNYSKNVAFVLSLYMIYPFCMDVNMVRYTLAISFVYVALDILYKGNEYWKIKYILFISIASMIHLSAIFFLMFLLVRSFKFKSYNIVVLSITVALIFLKKYFQPIIFKLINIDIFNVGSKLNIVLNFSNLNYNEMQIFNYKLKMLILLFLSLVNFFIIYLWISNNNQLLDNKFEKQIDFIYLTIRMNIMLLPLIVLIDFSPDLFRIQLSLSLANYIAFATFFDIKDKIKQSSTSIIVYRNNFLFTALVVLYAFISLYLWVLSSANINSVFRAIFENNLLIN